MLLKRNDLRGRKRGRQVRQMTVISGLLLRVMILDGAVSIESYCPSYRKEGERGNLDVR